MIATPEAQLTSPIPLFPAEQEHRVRSRSPWHPGLDLPVTPGTAPLIAYGRVAWDQITRMLAGAQAAWADYDGFHVGAAPESPPPYSHLWAWTAGWLARIRVDGQHAIAGVLALRGQPGNSPPSSGDRTSSSIRSGHTSGPQPRSGSARSDPRSPDGSQTCTWSLASVRLPS